MWALDERIRPPAEALAVEPLALTQVDAHFDALRIWALIIQTRASVEATIDEQVEAQVSARKAEIEKEDDFDEAAKIQLDLVRAALEQFKTGGFRKADFDALEHLITNTNS